jgi:ribose 5-phosphate isomerase A
MPGFRGNLIGMNPKQRAAEAALSYLQNGMRIGIGTGSTAERFIDALAAALKSGKLRDIVGVPTSRQSERQAAELGIPLATLAQCPRLDLTVDGADEIDPNLDLIKGLGGALLREKIVAQNSARLIIIADGSKLVSRLGEHAPLPVEVAMFGHEAQVEFLASLGCKPVIRRGGDQQPFVTDNGNYIYDCRFVGGITGDLRALQQRLRSRAGVVESGLFLGMAQVAIVGSEAGVDVRERGA